MSGIQDFIGRVFGFLIGVEFNPAQTVEINRRGSVRPLQLVYGTRKIENANVVFEDTGGSDNKYLYLCVALCEGEIEAIDEIFIDGRPLTDFPANRVKVFDGATGSWVGDDIVVIQKFTGTATQAQSTLLNQSAKWAAKTRQGKGVAYLAIRLKGLQKWFSGGTPQIAAVVRGKKVLDPRNSPATEVFTANAALCLRDLLASSIYGSNMPDSERGSAWTAAYNDCDATESLVAEQTLGTPDEVIARAGRKYLRYDTMPATMPAMEQLTLRNTGSTKTATAGVPFTTPGFWGATGGTLIPFTMTTGGDFTTSDTVLIAGTGAKLLQANIQLNTGEQLDTVMSNVQKLLPACRGLLPRVNRKYELFVEKSKSPVTEITMADIVASSGIEGQLPEKKNKVNRITAKFSNPATNWKQDLAIFPEPGSTLETTLLDADNGVELHQEISLPTVVNKYAANDLARVVLYKLRNDIRLNLTCHPRLMAYSVGDVVQITHPSPGWNQKEFLIVAMTLTRRGYASLDLVEYESAIYEYADIPLDLLTDNTDLPDPFYVETPANLSATSFYNEEAGGLKQAGINLTWDAISDDEPFEEYEVQWKLKDSVAWTNPSVFVRDAEVDLVLLWLNTYELRVRAINYLGIKSDWSSVLEHQILLDTTAPDAPTGLTLTPGEKMIDVAWVNPSDVDFKLVNIYLNTSNSQPATPTQEAYGDKATLTGLTADTQYWVWLTAVDDAGNESGAVSATVQTVAVSVPGGPVRAPIMPGGTGYEVGQLWQRSGDLSLFQWSGSAWVDYMPPTPTGLRIASESAQSSTVFSGGTAWFGWDYPHRQDVITFEIEFWSNGKLLRTKQTKLGDAFYGGRVCGWRWDESRDSDPDTTIPGTPRIKDGSRDITCRVYALSSDGIVRSAGYAELAVTNNQISEPLANFAVTVADRDIVMNFDPPEDSEYAGVMVFASTTNGFTPGPANLVATLYNASGKQTVRDLALSGTVYFRAAAFDVWGRDDLTYTSQVSVSAPAGFGDLAFDNTVDTSTIDDNSVTRGKIVAGDIVSNTLVMWPTASDDSVSGGLAEIALWTPVITAKGGGPIAIDVTGIAGLREVASDVIDPSPGCAVSVEMSVNGGTFYEVGVSGSDAGKVTEVGASNYWYQWNASGFASSELDTYVGTDPAEGDSIRFKVIFGFVWKSTVAAGEVVVSNAYARVTEYNNT